MASYTFNVDGIPKSQPRARKGMTRRGDTIIYTPSTAKGWRECITIAARAVRPAVPLRGPLLFCASIRMPRPASHFRKNGDLKPDAPVWCCSKGRFDWDNLGKAISDTMNDIGFWEDDGLVVDGRILKPYANPGERPGATITIEELPQ